MGQYFAYNYSGGAFELFGTGHLIYLALIAGIVAFLIWGGWSPDDDTKRKARLTIAGIMLLNEFGWHTWNIVTGGWTVKVHIPFHLCGVAIWSTIYMLLSRDFRLFPYIFFIGLAGSAQGVITPPAGEYGLPHYRAFQTLVSHGMIVISIMYITRIEGIRPTWSSIWKTMVFLNVYLALMFVVNILLDAHYLFAMRKPDTASLFDVMGPWPWYLVTAEVLAVVLFCLLYLPFALSDRREKVRIKSSD